MFSTFSAIILGSCATDMGVGDLKGETGGKGISQRI